MVTIKGVIHASLLFHSAANIRSCLILSCGKKAGFLGGSIRTGA